MRRPAEAHTAEPGSGSEIALEHVGPVTVIRARGELDQSSGHALQEALADARVRDAACVMLFVDTLRIPDTADLRVLLEAKARIGERLVMQGTPEQASRISAIAGAVNGGQPHPSENAVAANSSHPNLAYVRQLWEAFHAGGPRACASLVPEDVVWKPFAADGDFLLGTSELVTFWEARPTSVLALAGLWPIGDDVLACLQAHKPGSHETTELWSFYRFDGPRLVEAVSFENGSTPSRRRA